MPGKEKASQDQRLFSTICMVANPCRDASWYEIVEKIQSVEGERGSHAVVLGLYLVVLCSTWPRWRVEICVVGK